MCSVNVPQAACEGDGNSTFYDPDNCAGIQYCELGCCELGNNFVFTTIKNCEKLIEEYYPALNLDEVWNSGIDDEFTCINQKSKFDEGCCVDYEYGCKWMAKNICVSSSEQGYDGGPGFYKDMYCSNPNLKCNCEAQYEKGCIEGEEDVYWFDSCGNKESVAEDCDYLKGNMCIEKGGDASCSDLNCKEVVKTPEFLYMNPHYNELGIVDGMKHGESWCSYESGAGAYYDRPGSRHYRHVCFMGVELVEGCRDFREEICLQSGVTMEFPDESFEYIESNCIDNEIYGSLILQNISLVPKGQKFWEGDVENICDGGNSECAVIWVKEDKTKSWECDHNCHCEKQSTVDALSYFCKSKGDCGDDWNVLNEYADEGLKIDWSGTSKGDTPDVQSNAEIEDWKKYGIFAGLRDMMNNSDFTLSFSEPEMAALKFDKINAITGFLAVYLFGTSIALLSRAGWHSFWGMWGTTFSSITPGTTILTVFSEGVATSTSQFVTSIFGMVIALTMIAYGIVKGEVITVIEGLAMGIGCIFGPFGCAIGAVIGLVIGIILGQSEVSEKNLEMECGSWQAPLSGVDCEECANDARYNNYYFDNPILCSEYRCKSLGATCELINEGTSEAKCIDMSPNDVIAPVITPWKEVVEEQGYSVEPLMGAPCGGFYVEPKIKPLTKFTLGIKTNEPAKCRYDFEHTESYNEMTNYFDQDYFTYEHNLTKLYPGGKDYNFYVRCIDAKGNEDVCEYAIQFSILDEPDFTAPVIEFTSIENGGYVANGLNETPLILYLNEQANLCKWSKQDINFDEMIEENLFFCGCYDGSGEELCEYLDENNMFIYDTFKCVGLLKDIIDEQVNTYYISCEDLAGNKNDNYKFELIGTKPLSIISVEPLPGTYYQSSILLRAVTSGGAENGYAVCSYDEGLWGAKEFFTTGTNVHMQEQNLSKGTYEYEISCSDVAGNVASGETEFTIDVDTYAPKFVNIYKSGGVLHVMTDEISTCEYSFDEVDWDMMTGSMTIDHTLVISKGVYYVRCYDVYGNYNKPVEVVV